VQHHKQPHPPDTPTTPHTKIGRIPPRDRSDSAQPTQHRSAHDKLKDEDRMPHPATTNEQQIRSSTTDLDTGYDRSRAGERPISAQPFLTVTFERDVCTS
jgi:hypothetical protein